MSLRDGRGQADIRGLVTAGRAVRQERYCWSRNLERGIGGVNPVAAHSRDAGCSSRSHLLVVLVQLLLGVGWSRTTSVGRRWHQAQVRPNSRAGQSVPVPDLDLDSQPERRQRRDPTQAPQPVYHRGVLAVGGHQPVTRPRARRRTPTGTPARRNAACAATPGEYQSTPYRRSTQFPDATTASTPDAGPGSNHPGRHPGPRTRSRAASCCTDGTVTETISSSRNSLARCIASRASVLTLSPAGRWIFDGAAISHLIPMSHTPGPSRTRSDPLRRPPPMAQAVTEPTRGRRRFPGPTVPGTPHPSRRRSPPQPQIVRAHPDHTRTLGKHRGLLAHVTADQGLCSVTHDAVRARPRPARSAGTYIPSGPATSILVAISCGCAAARPWTALTTLLACAPAGPMLHAAGQRLIPVEVRLALGGGGDT